MNISVIIPVLNEERYLKKLLAFLASHAEKEDFEVIIVDGGSTDGTLEILGEFDVRVIHSTKASRASQMNEGAKRASFEVLYFVHADALPTSSFVTEIRKEIHDGYAMGCYRYLFDQIRNPLLYINSFFTRFSFQWCRGGDQTLFIKKEVFEEIGGYDEEYEIMEDFEFLDRSKKYPFRIIPKNIRVSARKYENNSYLKVQLVNLKAMRMYLRGVDPSTIKRYYSGALQ